MDTSDYQREVQQLTNDVNRLSSTSEPKTIAEPVSVSKIYRYTPYCIIFVVIFIMLLVIQPRVVLKVIIDNDDKAIIAVNKLKFAMVWFITSCIMSISYWIKQKYFR